MRKTLMLFYSIYEKFIQLLLQPVFYKEDRYPLKRKNERPVEFAFAFQCISEKYPDHLLDVGTGSTSFPHLVQNCGVKVTAIDKVTDYWRLGLSNRHFKVMHDDITKPAVTTRFDMVTCISVLEHIPQHREAMKGMFGLLKEDGQIVVSFPYNEHNYHPDIYRDKDAGYGQKNKFIAQIYSRNEINEWLEDNNAQIVKQEYYEAFTGKFWTMGESIYPIRKSDKNSTHHLTCLLLAKK